ncbi:hypothetical protein SNOG_07838 [Parastagonospora nodorum SN15]|uniref:Uncharacterized protein n=1 Tax=Phaeosphaeria nodorum (strain SN15 / ATCC MYA-4574 / FGSC 10173) TaxID=321614 RepID=Q0UK76_PHANO|nr:hypothetical protein SNOG_07838 [Parastagonospora nodorum SN15]EAT85304.1 hypothetical protein SNOG_07838 [Parastagonospora nodorum SN15]
MSGLRCPFSKIVDSHLDEEGALRKIWFSTDSAMKTAQGPAMSSLRCISPQIWFFKKHEEGTSVSRNTILDVLCPGRRHL